MIERFMLWLSRVLGWEAATVVPPPPPVVPPQPVPEPEPVIPPVEPPKLLWGTPRQAWHSVRVMCDDARLTLNQKNVICACIYQESRFSNKAVGKNAGSTDWGLVQVNDTKGWHIGPGLRFKSVQDVLNNPERAVRWMIRTYKYTGKLQPWASYTSGAYKQWLNPNSPMWNLANLGGVDSEETGEEGAILPFMTSTYTYVLGGLQVMFGILSLVFGWTNSDVAITLIMSGIGVFGLTRQNVNLGRSLGAKV